MAKNKNKPKSGCLINVLSFGLAIYIYTEISKKIPEDLRSVLLLAFMITPIIWYFYDKYGNYKQEKVKQNATVTAEYRKKFGYDDSDDDDDIFEYAKRNTRENHKINDNRLNLFIEYNDRNDDETERDIIVYGRTPYQPRGELRAFCELRKDFRTFKLNRIKTMVDKSTGEIIQNKQKFIDNFYS